MQDILVNHLPRVKEGLEAGYCDENQVLVIYDHLVRVRIIQEEQAARDKQDALHMAAHAQRFISGKTKIIRELNKASQKTANQLVKDFVDAYGFPTRNYIALRPKAEARRLKAEMAAHRAERARKAGFPG